MGALSLTAKEQYKTPFMPVMPGSVTARYLDLESARQSIKKVCNRPRNILLQLETAAYACHWFVETPSVTAMEGYEQVKAIATMSAVSLHAAF